MRNTVVYKQPKIQPLPGAVTEEMQRDVTLPVKIEAARRAIAACEDLPELLRYRDQAQGLAAAVRIMKHVAPEMVHSANCLVADAWRKGGELLSKYSNKIVMEGQGGRGSDGKGQAEGAKPSPRGTICRQLGISKHDATNMVRVASAPVAMAYDAAQKTRSLERVAHHLPAVNKNKKRNTAPYSVSLRGVLGANGTGLVPALSCVKRIAPSDVRSLAPDEKKLVRAKVTEIMELLDAIDEACK